MVTAGIVVGTLALPALYVLYQTLAMMRDTSALTKRRNELTKERRQRRTTGLAKLWVHLGG